MSQLRINIPNAVGQLRASAIRIVTAVVETGKEVGALNTPVRTGDGQRSWHCKVYDDRGKFVHGDETDGNGNATPDYNTFPGIVMGTVATNEIAVKGQAYLPLVNDGVNGRTGVLMKEQARAAMTAKRREMTP